MNMLNTIKIDFINCKYKEINLRLPTFTYNYQHSVRNFSQTFTRWILKQMTRGKININSFRRMFK